MGHCYTSIRMAIAGIPRRALIMPINRSKSMDLFAVRTKDLYEY